jgi:hypothetical protein
LHEIEAKYLQKYQAFADSASPFDKLPSDTIAEAAVRKRKRV